MNATLTTFNVNKTTISGTITSQQSSVTTMSSTLSSQQSTINSLTGAINTLSWNVNILSWVLNNKLSQTSADSIYVNLSWDTLTGNLFSTEYVLKTTPAWIRWIKSYATNPLFYSQTGSFWWSSSWSTDVFSISSLSWVILKNTNLRLSSDVNLINSVDNRIWNWFTEPGLNIQWSSSKINLNWELTVNSYSGTSPNISVWQNLNWDSFKFSTGSNGITKNSSGSLVFDIGSDNSWSWFFLKNKTNWQSAFSLFWNWVSVFWFSGSNLSVYDWINNASVLSFNEGVDSLKLITSFSWGNVVWQPGIWFHFTTTQAGNANQCWSYSCTTPLIFKTFSGNVWAPVASINWNLEVSGNTTIKKNTIFTNTLRLAQISSDPVGVSNWGLYYNTSNNKFRQFTSSSWSDFWSSSSSSSNFVQNSGDSVNIILASTSGTWCLGWWCSYFWVGRSMDWTLSDKPGRSCLTIKTLYPNSKDGNFRIMPEWQTSPYQVYCDMTTDGGWYTFYTVNWWLTTTKVSDRDSCKDKWLHLFVPRTQAHLTKALSLYNSYIIWTLAGTLATNRTIWVYWDAAGNYSAQAMNSSNVWANWNWHAIWTYDWSWFIRSTTHTEPSWDYTAQCRLWVGWSDANWLTFNDWSCMYSVNTYLCSAYDK
jgi:hypothetical protein